VVLNAIITQAPHLRTLSVPCLVTEIRLQAFKSNSDLRVLRSHDFSEFVDQRGTALLAVEARGYVSLELACQLVSVAVSDLLSVQQSCLWLSELDIGLNTQNPEVS
jgi:hypothetical protein